MKCCGCYKVGVEGYCQRCRKLLFNGKNISHVLDFDAPKEETISFLPGKNQTTFNFRRSIKYSLKLDGKKLILTESGGQYILKPIPPTIQIAEASQAPENEHVTMQIASQLFGIQTASNGIIYFKDGSPAYITRRFDIKADGSKYLQEDMAQISGRSRESNGEHFKYEGTYEDIGQFIKKHVVALMPAMEKYFQLVVFNYLVSNGDAHLKNFSLIQTDMGDYTLSPAYDLMNTLIHLPTETDTALHLYDGDMDEPFYSHYGFYGQSGFRALGQKISILNARLERMLVQLLSKSQDVFQMISDSSLSENVKKAYVDAFKDKVERMQMTL